MGWTEIVVLVRPAGPLIVVALNFETVVLSTSTDSDVVEVFDEELAGAPDRARSGVEDDS